jgi:cytochrome c-type biogenesis protein CcmH
VSTTFNRFSGAVAAVALALFSLSCAPEAPNTQKGIEASLSCQCGCGLTVQTCNHLQCSFAIPVREDITKSLRNGEPGVEIIARYAEEYGEKVLSAPVREGFNLLAWYGPYVALFIAGIVVVLVIRRWTPERITAEAAKSEDPGQTGDHAISSDNRDRLREELEKYEP